MKHEQEQRERCIDDSDPGHPLVKSLSFGTRKCLTIREELVSRQMAELGQKEEIVSLNRQLEEVDNELRSSNGFAHKEQNVALERVVSSLSTALEEKDAELAKYRAAGRGGAGQRGSAGGRWH